MLDHVTIGVTNFSKSLKFYDEALKGLGIARNAGDGESYAGYSRDGKFAFWLTRKPGPVTGVHVALAAQSRKQVHLFYHHALTAGGRDNGEPGLRPDYHPDYYAGFVLDPDGHNIEAVCHASL